jgi:hypothetical protein
MLPTLAIHAPRNSRSGAGGLTAEGTQAADDADAAAIDAQ